MKSRSIMITALTLALATKVVACSSHRDAPCVDGDECPAGTAAGKCLAGATCSPRLSCEGGYCIPTDCAAGTRGCACASQQTCGFDQGLRLSCIAGVCTRASLPADGTLGGACSEEKPCAKAKSGRVLACVRGQCEIAGCTSGELGCGCLAQGRCNAQGDQTIYCGHDRVCGLGSCEPGTPSCRCNDGNCKPPLICSEGLCRGFQGDYQVALHVSNSSVRACDVMLAAGSEAGFGQIAAASDVLLRHTKRSAQELVVSFLAREAAPINVVAIFAQEHQKLHLSIESARCYNADGEVVMEPNLELK